MNTDYILLCFILPIYQIALAFIMHAILKKDMTKMMRKKGINTICNMTATTISKVEIYDIPAIAENHLVDTIPEGTQVVIKEIRPMIDGRWYFIEMGSKVGYCHSKTLLL